MQQTYQYGWILPFIPLPVPIFLGLGLLLFPTTTIRLHRMWSFQSVLLLSIILVFSTNLSIQQINSNSIYQYVWSWLITNDFSLELGYLLDPLTSIMSILITSVGILVLFYSDNYMAHDQSYLKFFTYMSFFSISMLGLVTSSNLIQIYIFWELVGMSSYLLIGFWFTRPLAANACQKAFVTNRIGDFGLLLGILGFYWITGSFEFEDLFEIVNNLIYTNEVNPLFLTLCAVLLFAGSVAKSAQFPLHVWLPDAMEGPTPISALIHAATMVAAGIFLVARLLPLFIVIPSIMNLISLIAIITVLLGATLALAQKDIKRGLAYSTMSQLGYMMLALGMGSYRNALFHLITHAYSKALLFLGSGSIIHSMERLVGYSPYKSQNMVLMGGLGKHIPITKTSFFLGTLSLSGIPPLACFWSKDEILNDSWLYSATFALIAWSTAGLTAFYMFRIYFLTFEGHFNVHFQNYSGKQKIPFYSLSLWGKRVSKRISKNYCLLTSQSSSKKTYQVDDNFRNRIQLFVISTRTPFDNKKPYPYPCESDSTILFPLLVLGLFTLLVGSIGIPVNQEQGGVYPDILSKWLVPSINLLHIKSKNSTEWYEFVKDAIFSVSLSYFGIIIASFFYKVPYSSSINLDFINSVVKRGPNRMFLEKRINHIYDWSDNRAYIDSFYTTTLTRGVRGLAELTYFFDRHLIDGITNGVGFFSFFVGEAIKYVGGGRISSYLFFYLSYVCIFLFLFFIFTPLLA
uniref:NAD(P)H-quinone oxidoreductase subunit 5, chloroplastic n=1 Tax=Metagentiana rhodantha TaxID=50767 RepID=A0A7D7HFB0_9GENT|nr:NADH-plastoquinone oxidoreductase subunit 5 [Metagentiana rhodantha]QMJ96080.1 NADH-plastoquinone oxidoreductase subunit 5 [Metagentiana rhodantha]QWK39645.1 NADH-plastoquinone oxidoreductase subunit 5 [Metagentiana rhodantha]QXI85555.1 NADH-plastoquinone oxidoreductase subunit 5 [Metagentiana rhodantha]UAD90061.1 NADH-plastoquinone oxidoreductase subunit 5 [Metagentiana rhodantha]UGO88206.1 NADH dehydrogenase subunit 5 [Metagentiana rhodantha]